MVKHARSVLAGRGYRTALISRTETSLNDTASEINEKYISDKNQKPLVYPVDVTDEKAVKDVIDDITEKTGRIDLLVNNAGLAAHGTLEMSVTDFDQLYKVNLRAPFVIMKGVVPVMKKQKSGYIFNIASRSGKYGFPKGGGYSASKFGLVGLSESLYRELANEGIMVTSICPSWVNTDMARKAGAIISAEDMIQPDDIMNTINWLLNLSPGACVKEIILECRKSVL